MKEEWRQIPGFKDYEASSFGNIRSWKNKSKGKFLKPATNKYGYRTVVLYDEQKTPISRTVHRLILVAFLGESSLVVNHKDGNKKNNKIENLEYCTYSENSKHSFLIGTQNNKGENHPRHVFKNEDIALIRKLNKEYKIKQTTIAELFNTTQGCISNIVLNKIWSHV